MKQSKKFLKYINKENQKVAQIAGIKVVPFDSFGQLSFIYCCAMYKEYQVDVLGYPPPPPFPSHYFAEDIQHPVKPRRVLNA